MFRILRYFSISSLVTILVAAVLLVALYRTIAIKSIIHLGEQTNISLAQTALNSLQDSLLEYLDYYRDSRQSAANPQTLALRRELDKVMQGKAVVRIKLLDPRGIVVFSTKADQIGDNENSNPGYEAAIAGQVSSHLIYRDGFNPFDRTTGDENLIQTYLPIRRGVDGPVQGVFEVYTDVGNLALEVEHTEMLMILGAIAIMGLVYFVLLFIVRRADGVMEAQRQTIFERSRALEMVSAQLFAVQENERKRLAGGLHEGLVQSLAGIKMKLDTAVHLVKRKHPGEELHTFKDALGNLDRTIDEVRSLAMQLRPPSLDELGLVDTLEWYVKQQQQAHPAITLSASFDVNESDVPTHLRTSVYRVAEDIIGGLVRFPHVSAIRARLTHSRDQLMLDISDTGNPYRPSERLPPHSDIPMVSARERVLLSGGTFSVETTPWGAIRVSASWPLYAAALDARA
jgi:signal transduction histidine kinase